MTATLEQFRAALVSHGIVPSQAIEDSEHYDGGATLRATAGAWLEITTSYSHATSPTDTEIGAVSVSPPSSLFGINRLRRGLLAAGVPSEHAAVAAGMAAEYASKAYTHGYDRGFLGGIDWQKARMPNAPVIRSPANPAPVCADCGSDLDERGVCRGQYGECKP